MYQEPPVYSVNVDAKVESKILISQLSQVRAGAGEGVFVLREH